VPQTVAESAASWHDESIMPIPGWQRAAWQALPAGQWTVLVTPGEQAPSTQVRTPRSEPEQDVWQTAPFIGAATCWHEAAPSGPSTQESRVHGLASSHIAVVGSEQTPAWHVRVMMASGSSAHAAPQTVPSGTGTLLHDAWPEPSTMHRSVVHGLPSSQLVGTCTGHRPGACPAGTGPGQLTAGSRDIPSLEQPSVRQTLVSASCTHPVGVHVSAVHSLSSSQLRSVGTHPPQESQLHAPAPHPPQGTRSTWTHCAVPSTVWMTCCGHQDPPSQ
jgi:hypothetical protein